MSADRTALSDLSTVQRERDVAILERDEMRRANVTAEDTDRPLGQSVEYWQDRCLDHATALDNLRVEMTWLRNQMGDVRGMQSDGATPEEMDEALGRALCGERARLEFDETREALNGGEDRG